MKNIKKKLATATATLAIMTVFASSALAAPAYPVPNVNMPDKNTFINNEQIVILDNVSAQVVFIHQNALNIAIDISPIVAPTIAPNININVPDIFGAR